MAGDTSVGVDDDRDNVGATNGSYIDSICCSSFAVVVVVPVVATSLVWFREVFCIGLRDAFVSTMSIQQVYTVKCILRKHTSRMRKYLLE